LVGTQFLSSSPENRNIENYNSKGLSTCLVIATSVATTREPVTARRISTKMQTY
jgi:hypothetical protein